jgi:hypothetical protein
MAKQKALLTILEVSEAADQAFLASLSESDRAEQGSYEAWSAKDNLAHTGYWADFHAGRTAGWARGQKSEPSPQYDQANKAAYERFAGASWSDVEAFCMEAHARMVELIQSLEEAVLEGPSVDSDGQPLWQALLGTSYSHKLTHYSEFYQKRGRNTDATRLWAEWAELVAPLDESPAWQGGVHYNAACSLALAGHREGALARLRTGLAFRPSLKSWSRRDADLAILHDDPGYRELFAPDYWWNALEAGPQAEALADQFLRTLSMLKVAIATCPQDGWREGETLYQRPAGMTLHIVQAMDTYSAMQAGGQSGDPLGDINWEDREASHLPSQVEVQAYLELVEQRLAHFIADSDLEAEETLFPWTGSSLLSRALYALRHAQHHLADLAMELQRRGLRPPDWQ